MKQVYNLDIMCKYSKNIGGLCLFTGSGIASFTFALCKVSKEAWVE